MGAHDPRSAQDRSTVHNLCSPVPDIDINDKTKSILNNLIGDEGSTALSKRNGVIGKGGMDGSNPFCLLEEHLWLGVGDIIEKIIDCRYIGIFSSYRQK